jgi:hypothetical protein
MKIIGLGHYSRTGKDTLANAMIEWFGQFSPGVKVIKLSFGWKVKQTTHELYAWAGLREPEFYETPEGAKLRDVVLPLLGMTPVDIWVKFGTDAVRNQVYENTWIDYVTKNEHKADVAIVPDVRFPNEVAAMRAAGAKLVKVVRPGFGPKKTKADRALLGYTGWDYVVGASGEIAELRWWAGWLSIALLDELDGSATPRWRPHTAEERAEASKVEAIDPCEFDPVSPYIETVPTWLTYPSESLLPPAAVDRGFEQLRVINSGNTL